MKRRAQLSTLVLAAASMTAMIGGTPAHAVTDTATVVTAETAASKIASGAALTSVDKAALSAQAMSVVGYKTTQAYLDAAFAAYAKGDSTLVNAIPSDSTTKITPDSATTGAAAPLSAETASSACASRIEGFTVERNLISAVLRVRLATEYQHVQGVHNCECFWAPSFHHDYSSDVTGNGSNAGWQFQAWLGLSSSGVKYGSCGTGGEQEFHAQAQFVQHANIPFVPDNSWDPWITQRIRARQPGNCPDALWTTDKDWNGTTWNGECVSRYV